MKILHIINDLSQNGGAQRFLIDLVVQHQPKYQIKVVTLSTENDFKDILKDNNVEYLSWPLLSFREKWKILQWPDLVHSHLFPSIYLSLLSIGKKRLQTEHNSTNRRRDYPLLKFMELLLYKSHHKTVCITNKVREELVKFIPHYEDRYDVVYNGVDLNRFSRIEKPHRKINHSTQINIGMVGRLHSYKDHKTLIKAISKLPQNYLLHLAGDGSEKKYLQDLAKRLDCSDRIIWHGIISNVPNFLSELDIYVQSSIAEGFGLAAVEAMAEGLPVLGTDVPGLNEVIGDKLYLFQQGNLEELVSKIQLLANDKISYEAASKYSIERCKDFTLDNFRTNYYQAYEDIYEKK
ncbi:glycosyltransferase [Vibrio harveyi]|uniref:glycosyltransferase n=1 Tax=Vibrio harveyi TaxID=669 RepID=UPI0006832BE6|nr:glycosyltransferase [Vibrio harveyi]EKO3803855.1 glycosyltransferase [Vibrio harveyi]ELH4834028.1 glycosyltransferase [Vibrio harveyi]WCP83545.1 glycosyltransferase [Vibrio harveyi]HDM8187851.1 glycosyltransferase [Vibrio harveyi]